MTPDSHESLLRDRGERSALPAQRLKILMKNLTDLPVFRPAAQHILSALNEVAPSFMDVKRLIQADPSISAYVIQFARSFADSDESEDLSLLTAVKLLGTRRIRGIVTFHATNSLFSASEPKGFSREKLRQYSIATGLFSERIAKEMGKNTPTQDILFSAGLLHVMGLGWMNEYIPDLFSEIIQRARDLREDLIMIEREKLGVTHGEIGAYIYRQWSFPSEIVDATRYYMSPLEGSDVASSVVHLASALARSQGETRGVEEDPLYINGRVVEKLGLTPEIVQNLMEEGLGERFKSLTCGLLDPANTD